VGVRAYEPSQYWGWRGRYRRVPDGFLNQTQAPIRWRQAKGPPVHGACYGDASIELTQRGLI
jgi:hypothetical protein